MQIHRPLVRILYAADGSRDADTPIVDLGEKAADGSYKRTVIKVTDPEKSAVSSRDYFL
ncbi:MAG: hypothetical protein V3T74_06810 [Gemmatimonadales bacterium]